MRPEPACQNSADGRCGGLPSGMAVAALRVAVMMVKKGVIACLRRSCLCLKQLADIS